MSDQILTLPDEAGLLKMADKPVYAMAQRSEIPALKVRGQWRYKRVVLDRWIEAQELALNSSTIQNAPKPSEGVTRGRGSQDDH